MAQQRASLMFSHSSHSGTSRKMSRLQQDGTFEPQCPSDVSNLRYISIPGSMWRLFQTLRQTQFQLTHCGASFDVSVGLGDVLKRMVMTFRIPDEISSDGGRTRNNFWPRREIPGQLGDPPSQIVDHFPPFRPLRQDWCEKNTSPARELNTDPTLKGVPLLGGTQYFRGNQHF